MQRCKNVLFNVLLSLNLLLLFFVMMANKLVVPPWLQVVGRMHPLVLHFPIVLLIVYIVWNFIFSSRINLEPGIKPIGEWLLLMGALTAVITAIMGLLLSKEPGYNANDLWWHKWSGVSISFLSFVWYACTNQVRAIKYFNPIAGSLFVVLIILTGHQGAGITHGEGFLSAPVTLATIKPIVAIEDAVVFTNMVLPILQAKCISCHNNKKAKGELIMETQASLLKGGKHGPLWLKDEPFMSLLLQRIHLEDDDKKHMPPVGKPQLDEDEKQIIFQWIRGGPNFTAKVNQLPATDSLHILANKIFTGKAAEVYAFEPANEKEIAKLNNTNRLIHPIALGSPALAVNLYNRQNFNSGWLKELLVLKEQIVSLDVAYMPLKEEDIASIAQLHNLRKLNLNFSSVPGKSLTLLKQLPFLTHLSLSGTKVTKKDVEPLFALPKLASIYLWNAPVSTTEIAALKKINPLMKIEAGFADDTVRLKLTPPILETEERIITTPLALHLRHYIKGVTIRYTIDGTVPDSIHSLIYTQDVSLNKYTKFTAKAFKPGWIGSDSIVAVFYKNTFKADTIQSLLPLDSTYKGTTGATTLINGENGDFDFRSGKWLGFRKSKMEMVLSYKEPVKVSSVTLSSLVDIGGFLMPPVSIEVWGGINVKQMKLLGKITPAQPKMQIPAYQTAYDCTFTATTVKYIKVMAVPVAKLPLWHAGKGQKGWIFFDEIFVN